MENDENLKLEIGKRIDFIRIQKKMSKEKLAELIGISGQHLGKVINGESGLSVEKIIKLSIKTGYSTDYILLGKSISFDENTKKMLAQLKSVTKVTYQKLQILESLVI